MIAMAGLAIASLASSCVGGGVTSSGTTPAEAPPDLETPTEARLPIALIIGDSISIGYTPFVKEILADRVEVVHAPGNNAGTTKGCEKIDEWLADGQFDMIHFNWGLHDLKRVQRDNPGKNSNDPNDPRQADLGRYEANLRKLVKRLEATGVPLVFATTTPFPPGVRPHRDPGDAARYNEVALAIMKEHDIAIDDLYALVLPRLAELQQPVNVHFEKEGSRVMAEQVARVILNTLELD